MTYQTTGRETILCVDMALASAPVWKAPWTCEASSSPPSLSSSSSSSSPSHCCCKLQPRPPLTARAGGPPGSAPPCGGRRLSAGLVVIVRSDFTDGWGPHIQGQRCGARFGRRYSPSRETHGNCGLESIRPHKCSGRLPRGDGCLAGKEQIWATAEGRRFLSLWGSVLGVGLASGSSTTAKNEVLRGVSSAGTGIRGNKRLHPITRLDQVPCVSWPGSTSRRNPVPAELPLELAPPRGGKLEHECGRRVTSIDLLLGEKGGDQGCGVGGGATPTMTGTLKTPVSCRTCFLPDARTWFGPWTLATPVLAEFTSAGTWTVRRGGIVSGCAGRTQSALRRIYARADTIRVYSGGDGLAGEAEGDEEGTVSGSRMGERSSGEHAGVSLREGDEEGRVSESRMGERSSEQHGGVSLREEGDEEGRVSGSRMGERSSGEHGGVSLREDGGQTEGLAAVEGNPPLMVNSLTPVSNLSKHQPQQQKEQEEQEEEEDEAVEEEEEKEKEGKEEQVYAEVRPNGRKFFEVVATSVHKVSHGCIVGLLCTEKNKGLSKSCREFPLFLNKLSFDSIREALDRGGLPHALEALDRLCDQDLQSIYVTGFDDEKTGGEFVVLDEKTTRVSIVASTFPQAIAVALRYQQPFFLEREAVFSANTDFVDRMLINPMAREHEGDLQMLASLSRRMRELGERGVSIRRELMEAVRAEEYERAARMKIQIQEFDREMDARLPSLLAELKKLYLERMSIFFKL